MTDDTHPRSVPAAAESRATTIRYLAAVCLLPLIVLWHQDNILFTGYGYIDPWVYFGYFRNLVEFARDLFPGNSFGGHLSWILPGAAVHKLFAPLAANCILHLGVHTLASVSLFLTLQWVVGARRAFAASMLFSLNPWFTFATAWDYVDGIGIAYCLLTMALLTWAALVPVRRWALMAAGMALAAMVYSNADWVMLSPLLPLYYLGLTRAWHGIPPVRSFFVLCRWFGPGCILVTVALAAINYWIDGRFWFYAAPLLGVFQRNSSPAPWWQGLWRDGAPSVWLLFAITAAAVSAVVLFGEGRSAFRGMTTAALFSWLFLGALAWMIWCQIRGNPLLGLPYRASILLPFSFLAIGARFWPELETARPRYYLLFCSVAAVVLGYAWLDEGSVMAARLPYPVWIGLAALVASLVLRLSPESMICGLASFFVFTALGVGPCYIGVEAHGYRNQYQALCRARERIETVRQGQPVRFWYDKEDRAIADATALNSTYSYSDSLLSQSFGTAPCGQEPAPSMLVVSIGSDPSHGSEFVASALTGCWSGKGLRVVPVETDTIPRGASSFRLSLLRVERVAGTR
jgi:hypothetical protein